LPEGEHDGTAPWGANASASSLRPLPESWSSWPGHWGASCAPLFDCKPSNAVSGLAACINGVIVNEPCEFGVSPKGPAEQSRYRCPGEGQPSDPTTTVCSAAVGPRRPPDSCSQWTRSTSVVVVCSPGELRQSFTTGVHTRRPSFRLRSSRTWRNASVPGLSTSNGRALAAGDRITILGKVPRDLQIRVVARSRNEFLRARFVARAVPTRPPWTVVATSEDGRPRVYLKTFRGRIAPIAVERFGNPSPQRTS
jgi:hypothetical protein